MGSALRGGETTGGHMGPPLRVNRNIARRAGEGTRPYGGNRTGSVGSATPGAGIKSQICNFCERRAQWARKESRNATQILRAGNDAPTTKRESLVTGSGERRIWARSAHPEPSPGAFCLLFRHGKRRSPPAGGEIPRVQRTQSEPCPLIRHGFAVPPSPQGEGLKRNEPQ